MQKTVTIVDIAKEAKVSIATVSRVLTGNAKVSQEKREAIQKIIDKYGWQPNQLARGLINDSTHLIGLLCADIRNPYYASLCVNCEHVAASEGYNLLICNSLSDKTKELQLLENLVHQRVEAIVIIGGSVDHSVTDPDISKKINQIIQDTPVVTTGRVDGTICPTVNIDATKAMKQVSDFIATKPQFKRIAIAGGDNEIIFTLSLRAEFRKMLRTLGLTYIPEFDVSNKHYDEHGGYQAMNQILDYGIPDLVISINDFTTVGILKSIEEHKLTVPKDLSVISFDDTFISTLTTPNLTSISYNYLQFACSLIDIAIAQAEGREVKQQNLIQPKLIIRDSTAR